MKCFACVSVILSCIWQIAGSEWEFEKDFFFGAGSSAYQIEGGWNASDKGVSTWDNFCHENPDAIDNRSNGDFATNSYHFYRKDIEALKNIGAKAYRFSLSWSRLLPTGFVNRRSRSGLHYYNNLINGLISEGIEPVVTLFHWDTPEPVQRIGGFTSPAIVDIFAEYADYAFQQFGDRVKYWLTFNEININCVAAYGRKYFAPGLNLPGRADYLCAHYSILAHAHAYRLFHKKYAHTLGGKVGLAHQLFGYYSYSNKSRDLEAAELAQEFTSGWILHPIYTDKGDYPTAMKELVKKKSLAEGERRSRLPKFTKAQIELVKNSADFLGINYYTALAYTFEPISDTQLVTPVDIAIYLHSDLPVYAHRLNKWAYVDYPLYSIVPGSFVNSLVRIKDKYRNPVIIITENGYPLARKTEEDLNDFARVDYMKKCLSEVLEAKSLGVDIKGFLHWSLTDNFEWNNGYNMLFGLYAVNFTSPTRERTGRLSSRVYANIIKTRKVDYDYLPVIKDDATVI